MVDLRDDELPHNQALAFAREASLGLPGSIKQVADFLLSEGTGIAQLTMAEVAARTYTSKPTLVRFAQRAGYPGWKDYRHSFLLGMAEIERARSEAARVDVNQPFDMGASAQDVVEGLARTYELAVAEVREHLDQEALTRAARAIITARSIAFLGAMQNYHRGRVFASNLGTIGILCHVPTADDAVAVAGTFGAGDCVVATSYSGGLRHLPLAFVPKLKGRGVTVIAITNAERGALAEAADHVLSFAALEHYHQKVAAFYSGACTSIILDALYASCYALRYDESRSRRQTTLEGLGDYIPGDFSSPASP